MTDKALLLHWLAACSGPLLAAGAAQAQQAAPAQRPNILFILTDDQRWDAVGYVNPIVRTPHIDSLAREGGIERWFTCRSFKKGIKLAFGL